MSDKSLHLKIVEGCYGGHGSHNYIHIFVDNHSVLRAIQMGDDKPIVDALRLQEQLSIPPALWYGPMPPQRAMFFCYILRDAFIPKAAQNAAFSSGIMEMEVSQQKIDALMPKCLKKLTQAEQTLLSFQKHITTAEGNLTREEIHAWFDKHPRLPEPLYQC